MQPAEETVLPGMAPCDFLASLGATMLMFTELAVSGLKKGIGFITGTTVDCHLSRSCRAPRSPAPTVH